MDIWMGCMYGNVFWNICMEMYYGIYVWKCIMYGIHPCMYEEKRREKMYKHLQTEGAPRLA